MKFTKEEIFELKDSGKLYIFYYNCYKEINIFLNSIVYNEKEREFTLNYDLFKKNLLSIIGNTGVYIEKDSDDSEKLSEVSINILKYINTVYGNLDFVIERRKRWLDTNKDKNVFKVYDVISTPINLTSFNDFITVYIINSLKNILTNNNIKPLEDFNCFTVLDMSYIQNIYSYDINIFSMLLHFSENFNTIIFSHKHKKDDILKQYLPILFNTNKEYIIDISQCVIKYINKQPGFVFRHESTSRMASLYYDFISDIEIYIYSNNCDKISIRYIAYDDYIHNYGKDYKLTLINPQTIKNNVRRYEDKERLEKEYHLSYLSGGNNVSLKSKYNLYKQKYYNKF